MPNIQRDSSKEPIAKVPRQSSAVPPIQFDPKSQTRSGVGNSRKTYAKATNRTLLKNNPNFDNSQQSSIAIENILLEQSEKINDGHAKN